MKIRKRIVFGITSLDFGGAERVLVDVTNKLSEKYDITIFSIYDNGRLKRELSANIKYKALYNCRREELGKLKSAFAPLNILLMGKNIYNKNIMGKFDIEISFLEGPITRLFSVENGKTKKIAWIHNDIKEVFGHSLKAKIKSMLDKRVYRKYDNLVFVSQDNLNCFKNFYKDIEEEKMQVIYNYVDKDLVIRKSNDNTEINGIWDTDCINLVTVCRLTEQKAIDRFIKVHSMLIKARYNA